MFSTRWLGTLGLAVIYCVVASGSLAAQGDTGSDGRRDSADATSEDADASLPPGLPESGQARFDALQERALEAREEGRLEEALALYAEMQRTAPEGGGEIAYNRGVLFLDLERYERAAEAFSRAEQAGFSGADLWYNRGNAYYRMRRYELAVEDYRRARDAAPEDREVLNNLGLALAQTGSFEEAISALQAAAAADPSFAAPYVHIGNIELEREQLDAAVDAFTQALERDPGRFEARFNRGTVRYRMGMFQASFEDFLALYEDRPDDPDVLYNLGAAAVAAAEQMRTGDADNSQDGEQEAGEL